MGDAPVRQVKKKSETTSTIPLDQKFLLYLVHGKLRNEEGKEFVVVLLARHSTGTRINVSNHHKGKDSRLFWSISTQVSRNDDDDKEEALYRLVGNVHVDMQLMILLPTVRGYGRWTNTKEVLATFDSLNDFVRHGAHTHDASSTPSSMLSFVGT